MSSRWKFPPTSLEKNLMFLRYRVRENCWPFMSSRWTFPPTSREKKKCDLGFAYYVKIAGVTVNPTTAVVVFPWVTMNGLVGC